MGSGESDQSQIERIRKIGYRNIFLIISISVIFIFLGYKLFSSYQQKKAWREARLDEIVYSDKNQQAYLVSLLGNDPRLLQETFLADMENGINDEFTKSDAYFITHRYFDNGGNIYEIYDYVNSHKSLAFLKEAEEIYPDIFENIRSNTLPSIPYSTPSLYAVLAYMEVLDRNGYADIAALGTLANQYAKTAYFAKKRMERADVQSLDGQNPLLFVQNNINKAIFFELKAKDSLLKITEDSDIPVLEGLKNRPKFLERGKLKGILEHNFLVGLNQYAAALRYLEASGANTSVIDSPVDADIIFSFNQKFSKRLVPELELFTALLNASTLSLVNPENATGLRLALDPIILFDTAKTKPEGIVMGIIDAKNSKFTGLDIYSKINITTLGNLVPEFKAWLISNGWSDVDFE